MRAFGIPLRQPTSPTNCISISTNIVEYNKNIKNIANLRLAVEQSFYSEAKMMTVTRASRRDIKRTDCRNLFVAEPAVFIILIIILTSINKSSILSDSVRCHLLAFAY